MIKIKFLPNYKGIEINGTVFESPLKWYLNSTDLPLSTEVYYTAQVLFHSGILIPYQEFCQGEIILGRPINYYVRCIDKPNKRTLTAYTPKQLAALNRYPNARPYIKVENGIVTFYDLVQALNLTAYLNDPHHLLKN